ncbi:TPA: cyclic pyranopterin monophosphate synthase MoaC [Staphylococcus aureus]
MTEFTHINQQGHAKMVDVSDKQITKRTAVAHSSITVNETIFKQISNNTNTKGNVLNTAQIAGIMAAKNTSTIIPMCHPLPLTGKTGVEMEALTAASATALTIYDMTKAVDKGMIIGETYLESKSGGKSGDFQRQSGQ